MIAFFVTVLQLKADLAAASGQLEDARSVLDADDDAGSHDSPPYAPTPVHGMMSPTRLEAIQQHSFSSKSPLTPAGGSNRKLSGFGISSPAGSPHARQTWWKLGADWGRTQRATVVKAVDDKITTWATAAGALAQLLLEPDLRAATQAAFAALAAADLPLRSIDGASGPSSSPSPRLPGSDEINEASPTSQSAGDDPSSAREADALAQLALVEVRRCEACDGSGKSNSVVSALQDEVRSCG